MLIRIGFDIELSVAAPMALIYLLRVHPSRRHDLLAPENLRISGGLQPEEYIDGFGNHCGRVNVPLGMSTVRLTNDALIRDSGELDEVNPDARQHDPTELPFSTLQFLLPSRYCEVDSELLQFAWNRFGSVPAGTRPGAGDLRLRPLASQVQLPDGARRPGPRSTAIASRKACAATSPTWRSRSAAA